MTPAKSSRRQPGRGVLDQTRTASVASISASAWARTASGSALIAFNRATVSSSTLAVDVASMIYVADETSTACSASGSEQSRNQIRPRILSSCTRSYGMTTAKRNLKEQVLALRQEGKTLQQIRHQLGCSLSTVAYHIYGKTKISTRKRVYAKRQLVGRLDYKTQNGILYGKYYQFFRIGKTHKFLQERAFTFNDLLRALPADPICYLTGEAIDYSNSKSYSFDHKVPSSRGGENTVSNLGICSANANRSKSDMTETEFVDFCTRVLVHHGYAVQKINP